MNRSPLPALLLALLPALLQAAPRPVLAGAPAALSPDAGRDLLLDAMQAELDRGKKGLRLPGLRAPYFIEYTLRDIHELDLTAEYGALLSDSDTRQRVAGTDLRVGSYRLDNSQAGQGRGLYNQAPLDDDPMALRALYWRMTDSQFKKSLAGYYRKEAWLESRPEEKDRPADFCREPARVDVEPFHPLPFDRPALEDELRRASAVFLDYPLLEDPQVSLSCWRVRRLLVNTEGGRLATQTLRLALSLAASIQAPDGSTLTDERDLHYLDFPSLPTTAGLEARCRALAEGLMRRRLAPVQDPISAPALFSAPAACVFVHVVLGHHLGGELQDGDQADQTFKGKLGQRIMPAFLSLRDDPTLARWEGTPLNGHYAFDDQAVPAMPVDLVRDGVLKGFLMSRTPAKGFPESNGHGRCDSQHDPAGRMGNLILLSSRREGEADLKRRLMEECRRRDKPCGFLVRRLLGDDQVPQDTGTYDSFRLLPLEIDRVDAKTGAEEPVRGVELVGTSLNALSRIVATGRRDAVDNAVCGSSSGWVNVSVVSPALLFSQMELQKQEGLKTRLPVLPAPFSK